MSERQIRGYNYRSSGDPGCGGADPGRTGQGEPGDLYHQKQGLRLQRQERPGGGRLGEPDFYRAAPGLAKRIDYDTDRQAAVPYIGEYRLIQLPALVFLDAQHHMLWMAVGAVAKEDVAAKLSQFGG